MKENIYKCCEKSQRRSIKKCRAKVIKINLSIMLFLKLYLLREGFFYENNYYRLYVLFKNNE